MDKPIKNAIAYLEFCQNVQRRSPDMGDLTFRATPENIHAINRNVLLEELRTLASKLYDMETRMTLVPLIRDMPATRDPYVLMARWLAPFYQPGYKPSDDLFALPVFQDPQFKGYLDRLHDYAGVVRESRMVVTQAASSIDWHMLEKIAGYTKQPEPESPPPEIVDDTRATAVRPGVQMDFFKQASGSSAEYERILASIANSAISERDAERSKKKALKHTDGVASRVWEVLSNLRVSTSHIRKVLGDITGHKVPASYDFDIKTHATHVLSDVFKDWPEAFYELSPKRLKYLSKVLGIDTSPAPDIAPDAVQQGYDDQATLARRFDAFRNEHAYIAEHGKEVEGGFRHALWDFCKTFIPESQRFYRHMAGLSDAETCMGLTLACLAAADSSKHAVPDIDMFWNTFKFDTAVLDTARALQKQDNETSDQHAERLWNSSHEKAYIKFLEFSLTAEMVPDDRVDDTVRTLDRLLDYSTGLAIPGIYQSEIQRAMFGAANPSAPATSGGGNSNPGKPRRGDYAAFWANLSMQ